MRDAVFGIMLGVLSGLLFALLVIFNDVVVRRYIDSDVLYYLYCLGSGVGFGFLFYYLVFVLD